jgi:hypothetical protein
MTKPPLRLLDDPNVSSALRADLELSARHVPALDLSAGAARLEATLQAGAVPEAHPDEHAGPADGGVGGGTQGVLGTIKHAPWLLKVGLSALGVVSVAALGTGGFGRLPGLSTPLQHASRAPAPSAELAHEDSPADPALAPTPSAAPPASSPSHADAPAPAISTVQREIAQLVRIKALLERDPQAAYRLAQASLRELPEGTLREERAGLYVIAAFRSGDLEHARAQMQRFLERYPQSPLRDRLLALAAESAR